jgi:amidase
VHDDGTALWSATRLADAIRTKDLASRELLELYLARIERLNPLVNAVVTLDADRARAAARAADEALTRGETAGPLHGLPVTVKDAIEVVGVRSTGGAVELRDHVPAADAPAVARLKAAGAIVFGKTNCPRWSADVETYNELFGTTNNPWALDRTPGGSSGGPAAAVAAGLTSFELGTDIGGSIRTPAHFCGVYGLKPSFGVVPQRGYLDHVGGGTTDADINVFGPLARSAEDLDLLLSVLAGPEPERALAWRLELPPPRRNTLADLRIGVWLEDPLVPVDAEYTAILRRAVDRLADAGARVEEARPDVDASLQYEVFIAMVAAATSWSLAEAGDLPDTAEGVVGSSNLDWLRRDVQRAELRARWAAWFDRYDLLLCPVTSCPALPHDQSGQLWEKTAVVNGQERSHFELLTFWTGLIGIIGLPSAVVPVGSTGTGLPVGMQIVAAYLRDREAVHAARLVDEVLGAYRVPPRFASGGGDG